MTIFDSLPSVMWQDVADPANRAVPEFRVLSADEFPAWIIRLPLPDGWWSIPSAPLSWAAESGHRNDGGGRATARIDVYSVSTVLWYETRRFFSEEALRVAGADQIHSRVLAAPPGRGVLAVRTDGITTGSGRPVWHRHDLYLALDPTRPEGPGAGRLIVAEFSVQEVFRATYRADLAELGDSLYYRYLQSLR